jgi:hypothetical protein
MIAKDMEFGVDTARGRIHGVCLQPCRPSNNDRKVFENRGLDVILLQSEKSVYHDVETGLVAPDLPEGLLHFRFD